MSDSNPTDTDKNIPIGDSISNTEKKSRKDKSKSLSTKVVIRRLPPSMDEETFLNQIQPIPEYDYFYFVTADWSLGQNATSRAYINFINDEDIFIFKDRFDGYVFVETKGSVKRYSESRRSRMEGKDQSDVGCKVAGTSDKPAQSGNGNRIEKNEAGAEKSFSVKCDESKDAPKEREETFAKADDNERSNAAEDAKNNDDSSGDNEGDRPSLQIYQPGQGKRRMSTKKDDLSPDTLIENTSPKILSKPSSPSFSESSIVFPVEKPNASAAKKVTEKFKKEKPTAVDRVKSQPSNEKGRSEKPHEGSKFSSCKPVPPPASKSNQSQDEAIPVERKVSRNSERRNKIKGKQTSKVETADVAIDAVQVTDESKNVSGEVVDSEVQ